MEEGTVKGFGNATQFGGGEEVMGHGVGPFEEGQKFRNVVYWGGGLGVEFGKLGGSNLQMDAAITLCVEELVKILDVFLAAAKLVAHKAVPPVFGGVKGRELHFG